MEKEKIYVVSLGCPKNLVDSELITANLVSGGFEVTSNAQEASVIIVNTCAFILPAKEESIDEIFRMAEMKKRGRCRWLIVAGCLSQRYGLDLAREMPEVDLVIGISEIPEVLELVRNLDESGLPSERSCVGNPVFLMDSSHPRVLSTPPHMSYVKISEGCSNSCSYCIIPSIRGKYRSRQMEDVIKEVAALAEIGVKEIILIAQDTTSYGKDLKKAVTLSALLKELAVLGGIEWIRLLYTYPVNITEELLSVMAREGKICNYLDIPVQHIDDRILRAMKRRGDSLLLRDTLSKTRKIIPDVAIRTSIIVGFPGETSSEFKNLLNFVKETRFDHLGVFRYSREEGTEAAKLPRQVSESVKESRRNIIMEEQSLISHEINQTLIGSEEEILVEGISGIPEYDYVGRVRRQAPDIDGVTYLKSGKMSPGDFVTCRINSCEEYDLYAEEL